MPEESFGRSMSVSQSPAPGAECHRAPLRPLPLVCWSATTSVPDRARSCQAFQFFLAENLRDKTHVLVLKKCLGRTVARNNARAFLTAMLQCK